jgi:hypothetical protein
LTTVTERDLQKGRKRLAGLSERFAASFESLFCQEK